MVVVVVTMVTMRIPSTVSSSSWPHGIHRNGEPVEHIGIDAVK